jgi:hypothetical protein
MSSPVGKVHFRNLPRIIEMALEEGFVASSYSLNARVRASYGPDCYRLWQGQS